MKHATTKTRAGKKDATIRLIAEDVLGIETLDTRKSDGLDFHDLAVAQIRKALNAAYEAGRKTAR